MSFILLKSFILQSNLFIKPFSRKKLLEQVSQFVESMINSVNENSGFISVIGLNVEMKTSQFIKQYAVIKSLFKDGYYFFIILI